MKGKNAILTGCRGGIGRAVAKLFAERGVNIWLCLRTKDEEFISYINGLEKKHGVWLKPVYFDLMDEDSIKVGIKTIATDKKPVDILVNNAGRFHRAPFQTTLKSDLRDILEINFIAPFLMMQLVCRLMIRQNKGSIINIVSVAGIDATVASSVYGSSKAALALATSVAAKELGPHGIMVTP
jgi:3-oxoacyl-[acyl-carrier protein] reductase